MEDPRPLPGKTPEDPMCINLYCVSAFSCRRFSSEPYQGGPSTIFIDPRPGLLGGKICADFDPAEHNPAALSPKNTEKGALRPSASVPAGAVVQGEANRQERRE